MKKLHLASLGLAVSLAGCGAYEDFQLNNAVQNYKMACFGSGTVECGDMLVDTNILMLEHFRESVVDQEEQFIAEFGEDGYSAFNFMIDKVVEDQEEMRPGWFARFFLAEGQYLYAGRNMLLDGSDFNEMKLAVAQQFGKKGDQLSEEDQLRQALSGSGDTDKDQAAGDDEQAPSASSSTALSDSIAQSQADLVARDEHMKSLLAGGPEAVEKALATRMREDSDVDGGMEYPEARKFVFQDLIKDGHPDAVVLYTIEGAGGSNSHFQKLALFEGGPDGLKFRSELIPEGSVTDLKLVDQGSRLFGLTTLTAGPDDANCCPSIESTEHYEIGADFEFHAVP
ncbi:hypothetical protein [Geopseudomonas aromaticivorans]